MRCMWFVTACAHSLWPMGRCIAGRVMMRRYACAWRLRRRGALRLGVRRRLESGWLTGGSPLRVLFEFGVGCIGGGSRAVLRAPRGSPGRSLFVGLLLGLVPLGTVAVGGGLP